jgi:23S rRNA (uracil1939-C5)-methyltransferase
VTESSRRSHHGGRKPLRTYPLAIAEIVDLSQEGRGVARVDGKTVFIDDALPGEQVEWQMRARQRNFDEGRLTQVLRASPDRVPARCPHFGTCGGCVLQHLSAPRQIEAKQAQLLDALTRIGRVTPPTILPPLAAEPWGYRRRARLSAKWVAKKRRVVVGFRERAAPYIADVRTCDVLTSRVSQLLEPLSAVLTTLSIRDRVPQVEVAVADNALALAVRVLLPPTAADLERLRAFRDAENVRIYLQPGGYDTLALLDGAPAESVEPLLYHLPEFDVSFEFLPNDFVQVNAEVNRLMVRRAVEILAPAAGEHVLDLFCGIGNFSLPLARSGARVLGVEGDAGLIARAARNALRNGLPHAQFITANLAQESFDAAWATAKYDKVLLDPPRAGAREVLSMIAASGAHRVVYVSCHPGSLARDAGLLVEEHGFRLLAAGVMDMFPHTSHVESMAVFER